MYCCSCCCCCVAGFCCWIGVVSVSVFPSLLCSCLCVCVYICVFCGWGREANVCVHVCMYVCCFVFFCILSIYQELLFWHYHSQSFAFQHAHIYTHEHYVTASGVPNHTSRAWDNNRVIFSPQPIVLACRKRATTPLTMTGDSTPPLSVIASRQRPMKARRLADYMHAIFRYCNLYKWNLQW